MERILSDEEVQKMNRDLLQWVEDSLNGEYGVYIYNVLINLKILIEKKQEKNNILKT